MNEVTQNEKDGSKFKQYTPDQVACIAIALLSVMISFLLIPYHEVWRDEAQSWLIARDTPLKELFRVLKHEGHPALWFLILMPFAKAGLPVMCIGYISWVFTAIAVFTIALKSPFHIVTKFFVVLSPMFVYWYPVVSRSYAPVSCFLALLAVVYPKRRQKAILYGILLFFLINLHLMTAGIVGGVLLVDVFEIVKEYQEQKKIKWRPYTGTVIGIFGCVLMVLQLLGSPNTGNWNVSVFNNPTVIEKRFLEEMNMFFPVLDNKKMLVFFAVLLFVFYLFFVACLFVLKQWGAMIIYFMETMFVWYILIFVMPSGQKAYLLFSTFLFVLWIIPASTAETKLTSLSQRFHSVIRGGLTLLFALMCIKGYPNTIAYEITEPYTMGKKTAEYINQNCTDQDILIFIDNAYEPSVTAYLNRNLRVWDMTEACFASFPLWSLERTNNNYLFYYLYRDIMDYNAAQGIQDYTGTAMNDFLKQYIDQSFPQGTNIYFVMTSEMAGLYDLENSSPYYELRARLNGDCKYSKESFSVYHMVSGL